jgi:16S rRNA (cytidine1402-2'-O)-methyltransferase
MVFFEAPHRVRTTLDAMIAAWGPSRRAVVCRELTKTYEEVRRGSLADLAEWATGDVRGEITIVVAGLPENQAEPMVPERLRQLVDEAVSQGMSRRDAITAVSARTGLSRSVVYDAGHR